jgi:hypothetical protein
MASAKRCEELTGDDAVEMIDLRSKSIPHFCGSR